MGMATYGIAVAAILKNGEAIENAFYFDNEESAILNKNKGLFSTAVNSNDITNGIRSAFGYEYDDCPFKDLMEAVGDFDGFEDFLSQIEKCDIDEIAAIILLAESGLDGERIYTWQRFTFAPYKKKCGIGKGKWSVDTGNYHPTMMQFIHDELVEKPSKCEAKAPEEEIGTVLSYTQNKFVQAGTNICIPIPDGYHACLEGTDSNSGWCYIVPKAYPLNKKHIDAAPFNFGIRLKPAGSLPEEYLILNNDEKKSLFTANGWIDPNVFVFDVTTPRGWLFLFQSWYDGNSATWNKVNGFLLVEQDIYQFHIYQNHIGEIAQQGAAIEAFLDTVRGWMERVDLSETQVATQTNVAPLLSEEVNQQTATIDAADDISKQLTELTSGLDLPQPSDEQRTEFEQPINNAQQSLEAVSDTTGEPIKAAEKEQETREEQKVTQAKESADSIPIGAPLRITMVEAEANWKVTFVKKTNSVKLSDWSGEGDTMVVPSFVDDYPVLEFHSLKKKKGKLKNVIFSEGIQRIGDGSFSHCNNLESVFLPDSINHLALHSFYDCPKLKYVRYPEHYVETKSHAFFDCPALAVNGFVIVGGVLYKYYGNGSIVEVPNGVTTIDGNAFFDSGITEVILPDSVAKIGEEAFGCCHRLKKINVPQKLSDVDGTAFVGCEGLADKEGFVIYNGILFDYTQRLYCGKDPDSYNCNYSFYQLRSYSNISPIAKIPQNVSRIGRAVFARNEKVTHIFMPDSVKVMDVGSSSFSWCKSLTEIHFSDSMEDITFSVSGCDSLSKLYIGKNTKNLKLTLYPERPIRIEIPDSVSSFDLDMGDSSVNKEAYAKRIANATFVVPQGSFIAKWFDGKNYRREYALTETEKIAEAKAEAERKKRLERERLAQLEAEQERKRQEQLRKAKEEERLRAIEQKRINEERQAAEIAKWRANRRISLLAEREQLEAVIKENSGFFAAFNQEKKKKKENAQKRIAEIDETLKNL